jgi:hypothetical protein
MAGALAVAMARPLVRNGQAARQIIVNIIFYLIHFLSRSQPLGASINFALFDQYAYTHETTAAPLNRLPLSLIFWSITKNWSHDFILVKIEQK